MSATSPADPARPYLNGPGDADVIQLNRRTLRGGTRTLTEGWSTVNAPRQRDPGHNRTDLELVADDVEKWFYAVHRSLTDEDTAAVYVRTLEVVDHILKGAVAQNMITEQQRMELAELLDAAKQAPGLV